MTWNSEKKKNGAAVSEISNEISETQKTRFRCIAIVHIKPIICCPIL